MSVVLDASVYVAAHEPRETHHARARASLEGVPPDEPFLVPSLFRVEVLAALARRGRPAELLDAVAAQIGGPRFVEVPVDDALIARACEVARAARLRAYDAVYVAVAALHDATLLTLDGDVVARCAGLPVRLQMP